MFIWNSPRDAAPSILKPLHDSFVRCHLVTITRCVGRSTSFAGFGGVTVLAAALIDNSPLRTFASTSGVALAIICSTLR